MDDSKSKMPEQHESQSTTIERDGIESEDLTGRDQMVSNVIFGWLGHLVFIVAGFVMPRMIDRRLGQELLGVWDFAWSLVSYFGLVQAGVASAVNRYVAKHRATGDIPGLNCVVSCAACLLSVSALVVTALTITVSLFLPQWFGGQLGENVLEAQWAVFFLGASLAVQIGFSVFGGVLTGCHQWKAQNVINSGTHAVIVAAMIVALLMGEGLRTLAAVNLAGMVAAGLARTITAYRICEGLRLSPNLIRRGTVRNLFVFGGKTLIPTVSQMLLNQTTGILIVAYLGPAALALYTRPRSLIRHTDTLVRRMAMVLTPTTSSLHGAGNLKGIRDLLVKAAGYSFYMVFPIVLVLMVFGGAVMGFWMGPRYANGLIPAILAAGFLAPLVQTPVLMILVGLNAHGRAGLAQLIASLCSVAMTILALWVFKWGLMGAAIGVTLPLTILSLVYLPLLVCQTVGLGVGQYLLSVMVRPAVHVLPFAACLVGARFIFAGRPLMGLIVGGIVGGVVLAISYWRHVLPARIKTWLLRYGGAGVGAV